MGKKSSGKNYTSKGERQSSIKTSGVNVTAIQKMLFKQQALDNGKDVWFTVANPNKEQTNKPFIRVKVSGKDHLKRKTRSGKAEA